MKNFFGRIIKPYIVKYKYANICEIGVQRGGDTDKLLSINSTKLTIIDPCIDFDLLNKYKDNRRVQVYEGLSLDVLPKISQQFDCFLIDGDHNWYTVHNELRIIHEKSMLKENGTIFLHDVCWPYGRRDMYYLPESIPKEFCHSYAKKGVELGKSALSEISIRNNHLNNAIYEGGPRNGVLTGIEDFLKEYEKEYLFLVLHAGCGLGILIKKKNFITFIRYFKWLMKARFYEFFLACATFFRIKLPYI